MIYRVSFVCTGAGRQVISGAKSFKWKRVWASQLSAESSWAGHTSAGLVGLDGLCPTRAAGKPRHVGGTKMIWFWTIHFPHENWSLSHCHIRRRPDCRSIWNWWYIYIWISIHIYIYIHMYGSIYPSIWIYLVSSGLWRLSASPSTAEVFAEPRCDHGPLSKKKLDQMTRWETTATVVLVAAWQTFSLSCMPSDISSSYCMWLPTESYYFWYSPQSPVHQVRSRL